MFTLFAPGVYLLLPVGAHHSHAGGRVFLHSVFRMDFRGVSLRRPAPPSSEKGSRHLPVYTRSVETGSSRRLCGKWEWSLDKETLSFLENVYDLRISGSRGTFYFHFCRLQIFDESNTFAYHDRKEFACFIKKNILCIFSCWNVRVYKKKNTSKKC